MSTHGGNNAESPRAAQSVQMRRAPSRGAATTFSLEVFDNEVVPSSLATISPILRVASEIESERPRVAYLCRFYAFEKAHRLDQSSTGRGVRQFKTLLLQRLERDNATSLASRVKKTDAREIQAYYQQYYQQYVRALDQADQEDSTQLSKAYQTAGVLFEVLCAVNKTEKVEEVAPEIMAAAKDVQEKTEIYIPYNILPLDSAGASLPIMQFEEIRAAVSALWNTRGLNWPNSFEQPRQRGADLDMLDWLRAMFGFQKDSVRNQREHLILLLANSHIRLHPKPEPFNKLDDRAVDFVMKVLFKNYKTWCKFLGRKHSLRLPQGQPDIQQRKLLYMGLYLLIWGEASNVRFMPECLCYIFHNMAYELHGLLAGNVSIVTGENIKPSYGGDDEAFLRKVITPIYRVIEKEAKKSSNGKASHSAWCNYDDLNEYFWTLDCFSLGWPMRDDGDFFISDPQSSGKTIGFDVKLIDVNRTCKVTKGGQVVKYTAMLACGNYNGVVGFAKAKGPAVPVALQKAYEKCFQNLHYVERHEEHTIAHAIQTSYKKTKVYLWPASTATGMKAGRIVQTILHLGGFKNVKSKVVGSRNPHNTVKAVFKALNAIETPRDVQEKFGRTVVEKYLL
ncbi:callose synthase 5-like [Vicia villosa]|uniref:callose synthase 5-like n=1 Tax=Vicia villosa TaxID=3911 RepID=UPI00273AC337|nr:callose synthase 5-like [Vicia villosa]